MCNRQHDMEWHAWRICCGLWLVAHGPMTLATCGICCSHKTLCAWPSIAVECGAKFSAIDMAQAKLPVMRGPVLGR
jgi:hypothetical protein